MITDKLKETLSNHIEASLVVLSYHWCVEGQDFVQYHDFFHEVYSEYWGSVDTLAEYVRIVSGGSDYATVGVDIVKANKTIVGDFIVGSKTKEMCIAITKMNDILIGDFQDLFDQASKENIQGLADYSASKLDTLNKLGWKLTSITK
jgi:DNA-binding ferritin-like protein